MSIHLYRLARWCFRNRWAVLGAWLAIVIAAITVGTLSGGKTSEAITIPGTEAQRAVSALEARLPAASGASTTVVFATPSADITAARYQTAIDTAVKQLAKIDQVTGVTNPVQTKAVSSDKHVALANVSWNVAAPEVKTGNIDDLGRAVAAARDAGVTVEFGGGVYPRPAAGQSTEAIGIAVALLVLLFTFGSFLAAGMPIVTALFAVIISLMGVTILASFTDVASASTSVATLLGLSCGIDYGLFILSRYRTNLLAGLEPEEAAGRAAGTAGSSVVFAGLSVIVALCGMSVVGIPFLTLMGLAAAVTVLLALLVAITLVPAVFGILGPRISRFNRFRLLRRAEPASRTAAQEPEKLAGTRWSRWVVRRRVPVLIGGVVVLGVLCLPVTGMNLGLPGPGSNPISDTSRRAFDLTTAHFGLGYNATLTVVAEDADAGQAATINTAVGTLPGVASSSVGVVANGIALISVVPTTGPDDPATADLVHRIRDDRTTIEGGTGATILVGGLTATNIDVSAKLSAALPVFLITVAVLAFLLLTFAFRTILVPIKSILGFLLSTGAALGAQVAVFQYGWGASLFGIEKGQTLSFLPVILLAIMFGLSSDYEVFVVSRIKEQFTKTGDARQAVVLGTGQSARVVSAAALIMAAIFVSVMFGGGSPTIKAIGFTFAIGVFLDAFVVRLTLVPAAMAIIGAKIWYHPRWFATHVPDADIEGVQLDEKLRDGDANELVDA